MIVRTIRTTALALALFAAGCDDSSTATSGSSDASPAGDPRAARAIRLTELGAVATGLDVVTTSGTAPSEYILEVNGSGMGLIDYDGDGDPDLFVADGATLEDVERGPGCRLYENLGGLRFRDVTAGAGIDLTRWAMGVAVGDFDGDRHDDIHVTCFGPNVLLRNRGDGTFEDVSAAAGIEDQRWGTSSAFGDLDADGDLDLFVVNYLHFDPADRPRPATYKGNTVMGGPHGLSPVHDIVYENMGDGTFVDRTEVWGFTPRRPAFGLNVTILDVDHDGRQDVYVANDSMENHLYLNRGGTFEEAGVSSGAHGNADGSLQASMGIAVGDVDNNGYADFFSTNFSSDTNTLQLNKQGRFFDDRTQVFGLAAVSRVFLGWGCGLYDLDHDGDEDLLIFNGHVYPQATRATMDSDYEQPPLLFDRDGRRFERVDADQANPWLGDPHRDRAAVFGDLDADGDIDVVVSELNGPLRLLRNDTTAPGWLIVELRDERPGSANHRGLGARLVLTAGEQQRTRWIYAGAAFQSSSEPIAHFALPSEPAASLTVHWPDGFEQTADVPWNERMIVRRD